MPEVGSPARAGQWIRGNQNVQISHVYGSTIRITFNERSWHVPLEPATAPVAARVTSPARLVRARSGVLPYVDSGGHLTALSAWIGTPDPFAICLVGGRGGTGKTRLGVEVSEQTADRAGWLSGLLPHNVDPTDLKDLADTPNPRLVVIDYAETRIEQLEELLPALQWAARPEYPVRVLLLVRKAPQRGTDWTETLRGGSDWLESVLDNAIVRVLDETPPALGERAALFDAAAGAFARRGDPPVALAEVTAPDLTGEAFGNPLLTVTAAYLAVHGRQDLPSTRTGLLEGLTHHEDRYWASHADRLNISETLRRRIVALATLAGAADEAEAARLLRHLPELSDAAAERRHGLARWVHGLYPGPYWWNPLEPDLLGEYLVSTELSRFPEVLAGVLDREHLDSLVQPLDTYARAAAYDGNLADAVRPVLSAALERLCRTAADQVSAGTDLARMLGGTIVASSLERAASVIAPERSVLPAALHALPPRPDVILDGLALTLIDQLVKAHRELAAGNPTAYTPDLASALTKLSNRLFGMGRRDDALSTINEAVGLYRELDAANPAAWGPDLALSLSNLSNCLSETGYRDDALTAATEAVTIYRQLAAGQPVWEPYLAGALNNLSNRLSETGHLDGALSAAAEAVTRCRDLAAANPAAYTPDLASSLNNLASRLAATGHPERALNAITDAIDLYRELAATNPAAYTPDLALSLNNLSSHLSETGHPDRALIAIADAVENFRQLTAANQAAWEPYLAGALNNLSSRLFETGHRDEALTAASDALDHYRRLGAAHPPIYNPRLVSALDSLSGRLAEAGYRDRALAAATEAVSICRDLAAGDPATYTPGLAVLLHNLSNRLADSERWQEALTVATEAVRIRRELAAADPTAMKPDLAMSLTGLSHYLSAMGFRHEALTAATEAVTIRRELAAPNPTAHIPSLALSLTSFSNRLSENGHQDQALGAATEAVDLFRQLSAANPATYTPSLAASLTSLSNCLKENGHQDQALAAAAEAVDLFRQLSAANLAAYTPSLAVALNNLSICLSATGQWDAAQRFQDEAFRLDARPRK